MKQILKRILQFAICILCVFPLSTNASNTGSSEFSFLHNLQDGEKTIKGRVIDDSGIPLIGVAVYIKGSGTGTITDSNGNYNLEKVPENAVIVFTYVGMSTIEVNVTGKTIIDVTMLEDAIGLEEVVAIGYGSMTKKDLTGSIAIVSTEDTRSLPVPSIGDVMQGKAAGVMVVSTGTPGSDPTFRIRGTGTINNNNPLLVIDGVPTQSALNHMNMDDIESIQVLKDASATAIYGSRGANGVIILTTKKGKQGKGEVSFNAFAGIQTPTGMVEMLNAEEFAAMHNDMMVNAGRELNPAYLDPQTLGKGTDWIGTLLRPAPMQNYSLSLTGGNERTSYYVSGNYFNQEGIVDYTGFKRYGLKFNTESLISSKIKTGSNISLNHDDK